MLPAQLTGFEPYPLMRTILFRCLMVCQAASALLRNMQFKALAQPVTKKVDDVILGVLLLGFAEKVPVL